MFQIETRDQGTLLSALRIAAKQFLKNSIDMREKGMYSLSVQFLNHAKTCNRLIKSLEGK